MQNNKTDNDKLMDVMQAATARLEASNGAIIQMSAEITRQKIRAIKWKKVARSLAEAGTNPEAHEKALKEYEAFYFSDKF